MGSPGPTRTQSDLADMVEMLLDKGVVINADIAVSIGDTELLGVEIRAALASFETAAEYGLEFPAGTDMDRVEGAASGRRVLDETEEADEGDDRAAGTDDDAEAPEHPGARPHAATPTGDDDADD